MANDVIEARMRHLYELFQKDYDNTVLRDDYVEYFKKQFEGRKDYIFHYDSKVNIWNSFENGKVVGLTDAIIEQWVDRWIDSKEMSEIDWYNKYYDQFYNLHYGSFILSIKSHMEQNTLNRFDTWFLNKYLPGEVYPYIYPEE